MPPGRPSNLPGQAQPLQGTFRDLHFVLPLKPTLTFITILRISPNVIILNELLLLTYHVLQVNNGACL